MRLQAEKENAELTLSKIRVLEEDMAKGKFEDDPAAGADAKVQMEALMKRLDGEDSAPAAVISDQKNDDFVSEEDVKKLKGIVSEEMFTNIFSGGNMTKVTSRKVNRKQLDAVTDDEITVFNDWWQKFPGFVKDMIAQSSGLEDSSTITSINRTTVELFYTEEETEFLGDLGGVVNITERTEIEAIVESIFPRSMWKDGRGPSEVDVDRYLDDYLNSTVFNRASKKEAIPGGFLVSGTNRLKSASADEMMDILTADLAKSPLSEKLACFYIDDPSPRDEMQIETGSLNDPVLLIVATPLAERNNSLALAGITAVGLASAWVYSIGTFGNNQAIMDRLQEQNAVGDANLDWFLGMPLPAAFGIVAVAASSAVAKFIVAREEKFKVYPPWLLPSFTLGTWGFITSIKTPPKNRQALFNFAFVGPLVGMVVSLTLLLAGLALTFSSDQSQLPSLPVSLLRESALAGGIVEWAYGSGTLAAPDPTSGVPLHPVAITGFLGVVFTGFSSLPVGQTDGGRMVHALLGRSGASLLSGLALFSLLLAGILGSDLALIYGLVVSLTQRDMEVPCLNEVDGVDTASGLLAIAGAVVVALAVIPVPLDLPWLR